MAFEIKQYEDIVNDITKRLFEANTNITDLNESSIIRMLIETYSLELESEEFSGLYQQIKAVYEATRISTAAGEDLEEIGLLQGVTRKTGIKSNLFATLKRITVASSDFTISANTAIANQPTGTEEQLRFFSLVDTIFQASIADESQTFIDGIYDYKLEQRFYDSITGVKAIFSSVETAMVKDTNFEEIKGFSGKILDTETISVVDTLEVVTGWTGSTDASGPTVDVANKRQGSGSLKGGKTGTAESFVAYEKTYATGFDLTAKTPNLKVRIDNQADLDKISKLHIELGDSNIDYLVFELENSELSVGWNDLYLDTDKATSIGTPQIGDIKFVKVRFDTINATDTISDGNLNIDFIVFADVIDYEGDILRIIDDGTLPDSSTTLKSSYDPLSLEVQVEAEKVGIAYNVAKYKLTYKITALTNIVSVSNYEEGTSGEDIESDTDLRVRIIDSTTGLGKATVDAITNAIDGLDFVTSTNVIDMPLKNNSESFVYSTGTDEYQLAYEVAQENENLLVTVVRSTISSDITDVQTTIDVADSTDYSTSGYIIVDSEVIAYNGITSNTLENCVRGSSAVSHTSGTAAKQWFAPNDDFDIDTESKIVWTNTGNVPNDAETVDTYYEYRWLAHIEVFVSGPFNFTSTQDATIVSTIEEYKAAGIAYSYTSPTVSNVNVTAGINVITGYSFDTVKALVITALEDKLNSYEIDEDIYLSQLIDVIMNIEGVNYTDITSPSSTVVIGSNEIAKAGTIIINQI